jgi:(2Fe-2S) ferredoxin
VNAVPKSPKSFDEIGLPAARHHLFLCAGPNCCAEAQGRTTWEQLKASLQARPLPALRTKAACLRICAGGPWLVVYPEGIWYGQVTPERFDRIRREHLEGGVPVAEWIGAVHPLNPATSPGPDCAD